MITNLLVAIAAIAAPPKLTTDQQNCVAHFVEEAKNEAGTVVFENWPVTITKDIDTARQADIKCVAEIDPKTFKIVDKKSEYCVATADYSWECQIPKIGGGFIAKTLKNKGIGCCPITETSSDKKSAKKKKSTKAIR